MRYLKSIFAAAMLGALAFASTALAQDPTGPTYGGPGPNIDDQVGRGGEGVTGTLPFTGRDLTLAVLTALVRIAVGMLTRRLARARSVVR